MDDDLLDVSRITQALEPVEPLQREKHHGVSVVSGFEHIRVRGRTTGWFNIWPMYWSFRPSTSNGGQIPVRAAGFDDHLVKPVEAIELKRVLEVCQR